MTYEEVRSRKVGLCALPDLLGVLAPLRSLTDPAKLARSVSERIVATVASGCQVHLLENGALTTLVDLSDGPVPEPAVIAQVAVSLEPQVLEHVSSDRAWVVLPLLAKAGPIGALSVLVGSPAGHLGPSQHRDLASVASTLAQAMSEAVAYRRASGVSQALQASLLPGALPTGDWFELAARYLPGTADIHVGGDWYDSQVMPDGTLALGVGDVAGHGVEAAARMGELRSAMVALRLVRSAPNELIAVLHRLALDMHCFATVVCARINPSGHLQWASAGHLPLLVIHDDGEAELLGTDQSPPLGAGQVPHVPVNRHRLRPGDIVLIYTDGLIERRDQGIDESLEVLRAGGAKWARHTIEELVNGLVALRDHPLSTGDDVAILAARLRCGPPAFEGAGPRA